VRTPQTSKRDGVLTGDSGISFSTRTSAMTTGMAPNQKSQCQLRASRMTPDSTRPTPAPTPNVAERRPRATPTRSRGNSSRTIPKASGKIAPAAPCSALAATSVAMDVASAAPMVPTAKMPRATASSLRLPYVSPSFPSGVVATAEVSRKPVKTHAAQVALVCRSCWKIGRAGTTSVCCSTYATQAMDSTVSVTLDRRRASVGEGV
jgi:hypothetical protein